MAKDQPFYPVGEVFECGHCAAVLSGRSVPLHRVGANATGEGAGRVRL
jgi:hypothetical protein